MQESSQLILLIEDDPSDELLTRRSLKAAAQHADVVCLSDADQVQEWIAGISGSPAGGSVPSIIMLDYRIPKFNGIELLRAIRSNPSTASVPAIVFCSSPSPDTVSEAYRAGANCCVDKPVDAVEYGEAVKRIASFWLQHALLPHDRRSARAKLM